MNNNSNTPDRAKEGTEYYILVRDMINELPKGFDFQEPFIFEWQGAYQLEISKVDGVLKVTNGVNGYGNNCQDEFRDVEVKLLISSSTPAQLTQQPQTVKPDRNLRVRITAAIERGIKEQGLDWDYDEESTETTKLSQFVYDKIKDHLVEQPQAECNHIGFVQHDEEVEGAMYCKNCCKWIEPTFQPQTGQVSKEDAESLADQMWMNRRDEEYPHDAKKWYTEGVKDALSIEPSVTDTKEGEGEQKEGNEYKSWAEEFMNRVYVTDRHAYSSWSKLSIELESRLSQSQQTIEQLKAATIDPFNEREKEQFATIQSLKAENERLSKIKRPAKWEIESDIKERDQTIRTQQEEITRLRGAALKFPEWLHLEGFKNYHGWDDERRVDMFEKFTAALQSNQPKQTP